LKPDELPAGCRRLFAGTCVGKLYIWCHSVYLDLTLGDGAILNDGDGGVASDSDSWSTTLDDGMGLHQIYARDVLTTCGGRRA
jgi:hypothetical protein